MNNSFTYIITAGGIGKRMGGELPKQFLEIKGKPILLWTLEQIHRISPNSHILITLPAEWVSYWEELLVKYAIEIKHQIITGGKERFDSIKGALRHVQTNYVAVHDGVRPFVSADTILKLENAAEQYGQVIPVIDLKESIRKISSTHSESVNRAEYKLVQTPQVFKTDVLKRAYNQEYQSYFTDDASVVESLGFTIHTISGNAENIKLTEPVDLKLAEIFANEMFCI